MMNDITLITTMMEVAVFVGKSVMGLFLFFTGFAITMYLLEVMFKMNETEGIVQGRTNAGDVMRIAVSVLVGLLLSMMVW